MKAKLLLPVIFVLLLFSCNHVVEIPPSWKERVNIKLTKIQEEDLHTILTYNNIGQLVSVKPLWTDGMEEYMDNRYYHYDNLGRVVEMRTEHYESSAYILTYNAIGQIESESQANVAYMEPGAPYDGEPWVIYTYAYDELGRISRLQSFYDYDQSFTYEENSVLVVTQYSYTEAPSEERYFFDGKRAVRGMSDAYKFSREIAARGYGELLGFPFPAYLGNIIRIENGEGQTIKEFNYTYNETGLPESVSYSNPENEYSSHEEINLFFTYAEVGPK
jgi:hypothetical protein